MKVWQYWMGWAFFAVLNYFAVRYAVRDAIVMAARILGWSKD